MDFDSIRARLAADPGHAPAEAVAALAGSEDAAGLVERSLVPSAVLVCIVQGADPAILLTKRTATLSAHAGQVAFPGGRLEQGETPEQGALREAGEEIGLAPDQVELIGRLPDTVTGTGYRISPVLALVPDGLALSANPHEVESIFTLPLHVLLDPRAPQRRRAEFRGAQREFWVWPHPEHYVWGATAAILVHLAQRLREGARHRPAERVGAEPVR